MLCYEPCQDASPHQHQQQRGNCTEHRQSTAVEHARLAVVGCNTPHTCAVWVHLVREGVTMPPEPLLPSPWLRIMSRLRTYLPGCLTIQQLTPNHCHMMAQLPCIPLILARIRLRYLP